MTKPELQKVRAIMLENRRWILTQSGGKTQNWCAVSAFRVYHFLTKHGFKPTPVYLIDDCQIHCFNELDGMILDVTADQFKETGKCKVIISPRSKLPPVWYYGIRKKNNSTCQCVYTGIETLLDRVQDWGEHSPQSVFKDSLLTI